MARSYYDILEVDPDADDEEIRRSWRRLSMVWHPDRFEHDSALRAEAEERFKEINQAYQEVRRQREASRFTGGARRGRKREARAEPSGEQHHTPRAWRVRDGKQEIETQDSKEIIRWIERGNLASSDEILAPGSEIWIPLGKLEPFASILRRRRIIRWARFGFLLLALVGLVLRRPLLVSIGIAFLFITHFRR